MLRQWRTAAGMTVRDLAAVMGRNVAWVSRSERGERRVDAVEFLDWVSACRIDVSEAAKALRRAQR